jgi:small-conductance mechanosensitive channel
MKKNWQFLTIIAITTLLVIYCHALLPVEARNYTSLKEEKEYEEFSGNSHSPVIQLAPVSQNSTETDVSKPEQSTQTDRGDSEVSVALDGEELFSYSDAVKGVPAEQRARTSSERLESFANNYSLAVDSLKIVSMEGLRIIGTSDNILAALVEADAKAANKTLDELAEETLQKIKDRVAQYREKRKLSRIVAGIIKAIIATIVVIVTFKAIDYFFPKINSRIRAWRRFLFHTIRIQDFQILSAEQQERLLLKILQILKLIVVLVVLYFYIPLILSFFPWTERISDSVFGSLYNAIAAVGRGFVNYLPNLSVIIVTVIITYYVIRLCRPFFGALEEERISISGFYPDWAKPTYKLVELLIIALAAAIIFPYLPGFDSPAFQGISILVGALITFGGASTIANLIGGFIIIYTRSFQIGDRITIDRYTGFVLERTILSTRIRTINNEIVTIPNATMMASSIVNYTATLRDINKPLLLYTAITLGYDVPWRRVHETLINAALSTEKILDDPSPFVWQTSLDDFYVSYQLKAYTKSTGEVGEIYSKLHQNIQDKCNEVGIEIMSPHYAAVRDGNQNTIPENYLPRDYTTPTFRVDLRQNSGDRPPSS